MYLAYLIVWIVILVILLSKNMQIRLMVLKSKKRNNHNLGISKGISLKGKTKKQESTLVKGPLTKNYKGINLGQSSRE